MESYEYKQICGERATRLLYLQPGIDPEIVIELQEHSLGEQLSYEALSYTWHTPEYEGFHKETVVDDKPTAWVICDGRRIHVTPNCKDALLHLRQTDVVRVLWVDAICINQNDLQERSQQVILMQSIYGACARVLCWIGKDNDSVAALFDYIKLFVGQLRECQRLSEQHEDPSSIPEFQAALSAFKKTRSAILGPFSEAVSTPLWNGMATLHQRSYWDRIWVLQEVKSAPTALLLCGRQQINYEDMDYFLMYDSILNASVEKHDLFRRKYERSWAAEFLENFRIQSLIATEVKDNSALDTLIDGVDFLSTDPKDKVFAMIGLSSQLRELVPSPDYSQTTAEVYTKVAAAILDRTKTLDILYQCFGQACESGIPSWVPDWSAAQRSWRQSQSEAAKSCNAANGLPASFEIQLQDLSLNVKGLFVDDVSLVAEHYDRTVRNMADSIREKEIRTVSDQSSDYLLTYPYEIWQEWCQMSNACCSEPWDPKGESNLDPLWCLFNAVLRQPELHHGYVVWREILQHDDFSLMERAKWIAKFDKTLAFDKATSRTVGLSLCTTTGGRLALAPEVVQIGDKVVVIAGCSLPFVVRPISDGYKLIGACYVYGIMEGEAVSGAADQLVSIVLRGETDIE